MHADDARAPRDFRQPSAARAVALLLGGLALLVVAAGVVLWSTRGPAIFTDMLSAAVAWCF